MNTDQIVYKYMRIVVFFDQQKWLWSIFMGLPNTWQGQYKLMVRNLHQQPTSWSSVIIQWFSEADNSIESRVISTCMLVRVYFCVIMLRYYWYSVMDLCNMHTVIFPKQAAAELLCCTFFTWHTLRRYEGKQLFVFDCFTSWCLTIW